MESTLTEANTPFTQKFSIFYDAQDNEFNDAKL